MKTMKITNRFGYSFEFDPDCVTLNGAAPDYGQRPKSACIWNTPEQARGLEEEWFRGGIPVVRGPVPEEVLRRECPDGQCDNITDYRGHPAYTPEAMTHGQFSLTAQEMGRRGGASTSEAKRAAAVINARKGGWQKGRPRKPRE